MATENFRYSVSELERLTGISRRTIHFYVKEGVIAPPDGVAGGARYNEEHLLRLKLTRELQKSHLKLSGIREAMDRLSLEQMRSMLGKAKSSARAWDKAALERWLEQRVASIQTLDRDTSHTEVLDVQDSDPIYNPPPDSADEPPSVWNQSFLDITRDPGTRSAGGSNRTGQPPGNAQPALTPQSWERIEIANGLEVLVRSDLLPHYQHVIGELVRLIGKRR